MMTNSTRGKRAMGVIGHANILQALRARAWLIMYIESSDRLKITICLSL